MGRGALIVVEGLDRAGKTSQCQLLYEALVEQGYTVRYVKFPDRSTPTGQIVHGYLQGQCSQNDHSIHLLFSANRWEAAHSIESDLRKGTTVIVDRYSFSGAVYSAAKDNPRLSLEWAWQPEVGLPRPDLLLFLSLSPQEASERGGFGEEKYETNTMQQRVRALFDQLIKLDHGHQLGVIDAGCSKAQVASQVLSRSLELLNSNKLNKEIRRVRAWPQIVD